MRHKYHNEICTYSSINHLNNISNLSHTQNTESLKTNTKHAEHWNNIQNIHQALSVSNALPSSPFIFPSTALAILLSGATTQHSVPVPSKNGRELHSPWTRICWCLNNVQQDQQAHASHPLTP